MGTRCRAKDGLEGTDSPENVKQFRGGLVFKAHRLLYLTTLGLRVIKTDPGSRTVSSSWMTLGPPRRFCRILISRLIFLCLLEQQA